MSNKVVSSSIVESLSRALPGDSSLLCSTVHSSASVSEPAAPSTLPTHVAGLQLPSSGPLSVPHALTSHSHAVSTVIAPPIQVLRTPLSASAPPALGTRATPPAALDVVDATAEVPDSGTAGGTRRGRPKKGDVLAPPTDLELLRVCNYMRRLVEQTKKRIRKLETEGSCSIEEITDDRLFASFDELAGSREGLYVQLGKNRIPVRPEKGIMFQMWLMCYGSFATGDFEEGSDSRARRDNTSLFRMMISMICSRAKMPASQISLKKEHKGKNKKRGSAGAEVAPDAKKAKPDAAPGVAGQTIARGAVAGFALPDSAPSQISPQLPPQTLTHSVSMTSVAEQTHSVAHPSGLGLQSAFNPTSIARATYLSSATSEAESPTVAPSPAAASSAATSVSEASSTATGASAPDPTPTGVSVAERAVEWASPTTSSPHVASVTLDSSKADSVVTEPPGPPPVATPSSAPPFPTSAASTLASTLAPSAPVAAVTTTRVPTSGLSSIDLPTRVNPLLATNALPCTGRQAEPPQ
ncbi:hypothetical protein CYMTET_51781 [Cymbomonas tetramitiformis]|uniref:Uncharacterized protein n=1 Tax=Cymbomonas tetramitiformis TaxID=36881 RepID=A0AAE0BLL3_9CHLO|nr:hypothetical protein CYMTET_51781 [Cymbomonas tetramitiformis]